MRSCLGEKVWLSVQAIERQLSHAFAGLLESMSSKGTAEEWLRWLTAEEVSALPSPWENTLTPFQVCILVKIIREEFLLRYMSIAVERHLGDEFTVRPPTEMSAVYADTNNRTPCIFVLSPGADPTGILLQFAAKEGKAKRLKVISLGQARARRQK